MVDLSCSENLSHKPNGLVGDNDSPLPAASSRFCKFIVCEGERLSEELADGEFGNRTVDPGCAAFVAPQNIHPVLDLAADPYSYSVFRFAPPALVFNLSL